MLRSAARCAGQYARDKTKENQLFFVRATKNNRCSSGRICTMTQLSRFSMDICCENHQFKKPVICTLKWSRSSTCRFCATMRTCAISSALLRVASTSCSADSVLPATACSVISCACGEWVQLMRMCTTCRVVCLVGFSDALACVF